MTLKADCREAALCREPDLPHSRPGKNRSLKSQQMFHCFPQSPSCYQPLSAWESLPQRLQSRLPLQQSRLLITSLFAFHQFYDSNATARPGAACGACSPWFIQRWHEGIPTFSLCLECHPVRKYSACNPATYTWYNWPREWQHHVLVFPNTLPRQTLNRALDLGPLSCQAELTTNLIKSKSYKMQLSTLQKFAEIWLSLFS